MGEHATGWDHYLPRLAEVAASLSCDLIVNVQGDEPLLHPSMIEEAIEPFPARWAALDLYDPDPEAVGKSYVAKYFPPETKAQADELVYVSKGSGTLETVFGDLPYGVLPISPTGTRSLSL